MSKVFNMVGGGGGKNISSIIITGLESTDTVTCTKDGKSYTATWDATAKHWEIVGLPLGTFTVTATNGAKTTTETVLIDIAGVYEIEMDYKLWLYKDGDECEDVTGGWEKLSYTSISGYTQRNDLLGVSTVDECISLTFSPSSGLTWCAFGTKNTVDITDFTKVCFEIYAPNAPTGTYDDVGLKSNSTQSKFLPTGGIEGNRIVNSGTSSVTEKSIFEIDISSCSGRAFASIEFTHVSASASSHVIIYKVWLE